MGKNTTKYILNAWKDLSEMKVDSKRDYLLDRIFNNNKKLFKMIQLQQTVIEEYHENKIGEVHKQNYIDTYEDILDLIDFTMEYVNEELDKEADRKS